MLREDYLQQHAFSEVDGHCSLEKGYWMLRGILALFDHCHAAIERGTMHINDILNLPQLEQCARFKEVPQAGFKAHIEEFMRSLETTFAGK